MAINEYDPARGTGDEKVTEAVSPGLDAPPGAQNAEPPGSAHPDPTRGGCLKFGWGCLPVAVGIVLLPTGLFF